MHLFWNRWPFVNHQILYPYSVNLVNRGNSCLFSSSLYTWDQRVKEIQQGWCSLLKVMSKDFCQMNPPWVLRLCVSLPCWLNAKALTFSLIWRYFTSSPYDHSRSTELVTFDSQANIESSYSFKVPQSRASLPSSLKIKVSSTITT